MKMSSQKQRDIGRIKAKSQRQCCSKQYKWLKCRVCQQNIQGLQKLFPSWNSHKFHRCIWHCHLDCIFLIYLVNFGWEQTALKNIIFWPLLRERPSEGCLAGISTFEAVSFLTSSAKARPERPMWNFFSSRLKGEEAALLVSPFLLHRHVAFQHLPL